MAQDYTKHILMALNSLRTESDALVLYWENRLGVPNGTLPSDGVPIKEESPNSGRDTGRCIRLRQPIYHTKRITCQKKCRARRGLAHPQVAGEGSNEPDPPLATVG